MSGAGSVRAARVPLHALLREPAVWAIVGANALTLWVALAQGWPVALLLWPYWLQSVLIGAFAYRRIRALQRFSSDGLSFGDVPAEATPEVRDRVAQFLLIHFGIFHGVYLLFLLAALLFGEGGTPGARDWAWIGLLALAFLPAQWLAFRRDVAEDAGRAPHLGALLLLPYPRVLPMHLMIILGTFVGAGAPALLLFTALKTLADITMHVMEQRWLRRDDGGLRVAVRIG
jgi:hypothetical protein